MTPLPTPRRFLADEDGSLSLLTLGLLPAMIVAGGMAVDYMHLEASRVRLQATLDRAVVAAAALTQTRDPEEVVRDYFARAGLGDRLRDVDVEEALNFREVRATASIELDTFFLRLIGRNTLAATAAGSAIESHSSVEIALVLDVSGSMNSNQRLPRLKVAASNFIDSVLAANRDLAEVSISIVPFSTQVSAGPDILSHFALTQPHGYSHCLDFTLAAFRTTEVNLGVPHTQTGHFDPFYVAARPLELPVCPPAAETNRRIVTHGSDAGILRGRIGALSASGNTSIDLGVKWGSWLLDPTSRPLVSAGIAAGRIDADFAGRPLAYDEEDGMKVLIVMSDGANTTQYGLRPEYADGLSEIWRDPNTNWTSRRSWRNNRWQWYSPHDKTWRNEPYDNDGKASNGVGDPVQLTEMQFWADYSLRWYANTYSESTFAPAIQIQQPEKDSRTHDICEATKAAGVIVFAIGFEADAHGDDTLRDCASSNAHFFDVEGLEIEQAFRAISSTINRLRLST